ncbi:MAG: hypothetical protein CFH01_00333 [Alphaproteobacteria bacterium MarineAlpha2_Bin1]|nr:MAG: hypothetical protein CFH01_00333 [Alphaproteobacteria bacterium MarineAlpha2_Bin1]
MVKKLKDGYLVYQKKINRTMKKNLKIRGLKVPPSIILSNFCDDKRIRNNYDLSFELWKNKEDQDEDLKNFDIDLCIIPVNLSYKLFQIGYPLKLLSVNIWGILHVMSMKFKKISWENIAGKSIAIPIKGNMPDTIFKVLANKNNPNIFEQTEVKYCNSYYAAYKKLIEGEIDFAVLPEPYASDIELKGANRVLNLQNEWGKSFKSKPRYPQACTVINNRFSKEERLMFFEALQSSTVKIYDDMQSTSLKGEDLLGINNEVIYHSFTHCNVETISGSDSMKEICSFFEILNNFSDEKDKLGKINNNFIAL